jgi:hypothetical protein
VSRAQIIFIDGVARLARLIQRLTSGGIAIYIHCRKRTTGDADTCRYRAYCEPADTSRSFHWHATLRVITSLCRPSDAR